MDLFQSVQCAGTFQKVLPPEIAGATLSSRGATVPVPEKESAEERDGCVHSTQQEEAFISPIAFLQHEGFTLANYRREARENATAI